MFTALISIHAPHARSDWHLEPCRKTLFYFNPRSSCEERPDFAKPGTDTAGFQSTLLMRGATLETGLKSRACTFQSTLLMRGATCACLSSPSTSTISIHAPHARSDDTVPAHPRSSCTYFNPRSSCEERRRPSCGLSGFFYFNPRSSCEERHSTSRSGAQ